MSRSTARLNNLLRLAMSGDRDALGQLLEGHRGFLRVLAEREIGGQLQARVAGSDLVQETFISALRNFDGFQGEQPAEFVAWLKRIHERNIQDAIRNHVLIGKRAVGRQQTMPESGRGISLAVAASSPSQRAMRGEQVIVLAQALDKLPDDQREAIRLRYFEGLPLAEIAEIIDRTPSAVAGLLTRGLDKLRRKLRTTD